MMNVLVVNESIGKSFSKSKSIISKYLPQLGQKTYSGSISMEGLESLYNELNNNSSKYMSISCIEQKNKHVKNVLWIVGNKNKFNPETGEYAVASKSIDTEYIGFTDQEKYWKTLTEVAALLHDIGKCNNDFQNKLKKPNGSQENFEIFRHEAVSAIIFLLFLHKYLLLNEKDKSENIKKIFIDVIEEIKPSHSETLDNLFAKYNQLLEDTHKKIQGLYINGNTNNVSKPNKYSKIKQLNSSNNEEITYFEKSCIGVLWVILTHHRLIETEYFKNGKREFKDELTIFHKAQNKSTFCNMNFENYHLNESEIKEKLINNFSFEQDNCFNDNLWIKNLTTKLLSLKEFSELESVKTPNDNYISILAHYSRTTMILSDYIASITKSKKDNNLNNNGYFKKNKICIANLHGDTWGDSVSTHLKSVSKNIRKVHSYRKKSQNIKGQFKVENFQLKKLLDTLNDHQSKFKWQNEAYFKIKNETQNQNFGNLVMIISETGSGKTIAGAKIMNALQKDGLRFTLGLGLRTLTLQSGTEYRNALGLNDEKVAVVLGSTLSKKMYESGSEVLNDDIEDLIIDLKEKPLKNSWIDSFKNNDDLNDLSSINSNKIGKLVDTPIVVSTVDQFIKITDLSKPSSLKLLPRIFSSDLILDEIDSYSPNDLIELMKLIYVYAFYGRNVIVMSATVNKNVLEKIDYIYKKGYENYIILNNIKKEANTFLVSNIIETKKIKSTNEIEEYLNDFVNKQESNDYPKKLKLNNIVDISSSNLENWKEKIYEEALKMHNQFNEEGVSVGFVKFNTVASARSFAHYLFSESDENLKINNEFKISVLCYHSKYTPLELQNIEQDLSKIIVRKNNNEFLKKRKEKIKELKEKLGGDKVKQIMIIISTTSIIEIGRDHDYDFAIIEPTTNRALIQSAGRVLRHREGNCENRVSVLSNMIKLITEKTKASDLWKNTGVFNYLNEYDINNNNLLDFNSMFSNVYNQKIISSEMFKSVSNEMRYLEDKVFTKVFSLMLDDYIKMKILNSSQYKNFFRKNNMNQSTNINLINFVSFKNIKRLEYNLNSFKHIYINGNEYPIEDFNVKKERIFLSFNIKEFNRKYLTKNSFNENEIFELYTYELKSYANNKSISYNWLIGFNNKSVLL